MKPLRRPAAATAAYRLARLPVAFRVALAAGLLDSAAEVGNAAARVGLGSPSLDLDHV
jgi:hypothetical protein